MPFYPPNKMDKEEKGKQLAELEWGYSSAQKEAFALAREFGRLVIARDIEPKCAIAAATWFIEMFSTYLPPEERREALAGICEQLLEQAPDDNNPV